MLWIYLISFLKVKIILCIICINISCNIFDLILFSSYYLIKYNHINCKVVVIIHFFSCSSYTCILTDASRKYWQNQFGIPYVKTIK